MRSCAPRRWSDRRLLIGAVALVAIGLLGFTVTRDLLLAGALVAATAAADALLLRVRAPGRGDLRLVRMRAGPARAGDERPGAAMVRVEATVACDGACPPILLTPIVPPGMQLLPPGGVCGRPRSGGMDGTFLLRPTRATNAAFAGAMVRWSSPLGLFSAARFLPARRVIPLLPASAGSGQPLVTAFMRGRIDLERRARVLGAGTEFRELREAVGVVAARRIDWKATARRGQAIVREFDESLPLTISVVLDGSRDLALAPDGGFAGAADLVLKLGELSTGEGRALTLVAYDETLLISHRLGRGAGAVRRLMAPVLALPDQALGRAAERAGPATVDELARGAAARLGTRPARFEQFLAEYLPDLEPRERPARFLADLDPAALAGLADRCAACGAPRFADEGRCNACGDEDPGGVPRRAACAAAALVHVLRRGQGRHFVIFISALQGGETCSAVTNALAGLGAGATHRSIHVVVPGLRRLARARLSHPGSLGHAPSRRELRPNIERVRHGLDVVSFRTALIEAGVTVHALEDRDDLDSIIAGLLERELHL